MQTIKLDPKVLRDREENPKLHTREQIEHVKRSIQEFGFTQPVVVDEKNIILIGHARTQAARELELKTVPVFRYTGLDETEKLALCALDNQLAQQTPLDRLKLETLFRRLDQNAWPMAEFGFDMDFETATEGLTEPEVDEPGGIKQIVILFGEEFDEVMKGFAAIEKARPDLTDNTMIFMELLDHYEEVACFAE